MFYTTWTFGLHRKSDLITYRNLTIVDKDIDKG